MPAIMAVERVFELVSERFAIEAPAVQLAFGWRAPPNQLQQGSGRANRIAFVPGDDTKAGKWLDARYPGKLSRALKTMLEPVTVYVWAFDGLDPHSHLAQWRACRFLLDATVRACHLALVKLAGLHDQEPFGAAEWVMSDTERSFGAECRFVLTLMSTVPDELPDLSGPPREEITNQVLTLDVEIARSEDDLGELDPPPLTPAEE